MGEYGIGRERDAERGWEREREVPNAFYGYDG
jgi:hypothetical protein